MSLPGCRTESKLLHAQRHHLLINKAHSSIGISAAHCHSMLSMASSAARLKKDSLVTTKMTAAVCMLLTWSSPGQLWICKHAAQPLNQREVAQLPLGTAMAV